MIEWTILPGDDSAWVLRCSRCGACSRRFVATGESDTANVFQEAFERAHATCCRQAGADAT